MTLSEAISVRTSLRTYLPDPITPEQRRELGKVIDMCNRRSGLHFRLVCDRPGPFDSIKKSYGMLRGVRNFFVFAGPADDPNLEEKCGYYGEQVVLTAVTMGLGTCWVGGTYDRKECQDLIEPGEKLVCVAAVGFTPKEPTGREKFILKAVRPKRRAASELAEGLDRAPDWYADGVAAAQLAPSAMNRQGYRFTWGQDATARASLTDTGAFSLVDLGIAKLHFELGAHGGEWMWGGGGAFRKAREEKSCGAVPWRMGPRGRRYLMVRHVGGHWGFPKGHMEGDETEAETAKREILEETGLEVELDTGFRQVVTYSPKRGVIKDVVFFVAQPVGGKERPQKSEVSSLGWFSLRSAREMATYATDEEILLAAEAYLKEQQGED